MHSAWRGQPAGSRPANGGVAITALGRTPGRRRAAKISESGVRRQLASRQFFWTASVGPTCRNFAVIR